MTFKLVINLNTSENVFLDPTVSVIFKIACKHLKKLYNTNSLHSRVVQYNIYYQSSTIL